MTLVGVLICLWFFGGLLYELLRHWQREREKQRLARKRQQEELNDRTKHYQQWKEEIEPRHRYQAGYPDDWEMRRYEVCQRANGKCESCGIQLRYPQYGTHFRLSLPVGAH